MVLTYRGVIYQPEHQPAIAQFQQTLQFLGQPYRSSVEGQLKPAVEANRDGWRDRLQFLGQRYSLPSIPMAT